MSVQLLGVDVGGTKVAVGALQDGRLEGPHKRATEKGGGEELIEQIVAGVDDLRESSAGAVGVAVPSIIEFATGRVRSSVNVPLQDVPLRSVLEERLGLPVFVDNDATVAALAEAHDGDRLMYSDLVMLTVGTGVGGGLVLNGRLYRGATGAAAELGHTFVGLDLERGAPEPAAAWPQPGSLEALASGFRGLDPIAARIAAEDPDSALGRMAADGREVRGPELVAAAQEGDERALAGLTLLGERLGIGIANAVNTFDPQAVVIGGGVAQGAGELLLEPARRVARSFILPGVGEELEIVLARYGNDAGVRGAALMAGQELAMRELAA
jgi:glucokinase